MLLANSYCGINEGRRSRRSGLRYLNGINDLAPVPAALHVLDAMAHAQIS